MSLSKFWVGALIACFSMTALGDLPKQCRPYADYQDNETSVDYKFTMANLCYKKEMDARREGNKRMATYWGTAYVVWANRGGLQKVTEEIETTKQRSQSEYQAKLAERQAVIDQQNKDYNDKLKARQALIQQQKSAYAASLAEYCAKYPNGQGCGSAPSGAE